MLIFI